MTILQRSRLAVLAAGLGLSFATPALAGDAHQAWALKLPQASPPQQLAYLPPLPAAPRVFAMTPERRAMLNTIRYSEGTWVNGHPMGYQMLFGGSYFPRMDRHPDRVMYSSRYASAAAGAYQFMPPTWDMVSRALSLTDFQPISQDQGALFLIKRRGALALVDRGEFTPELTARLAPEWASFPTLAGSSYYGQPVKRFADLKRFYEDNLAQLRQGGEEAWQTVAIRRIPPVVPVVEPVAAAKADLASFEDTASEPEAPTGRVDPSGKF